MAEEKGTVVCTATHAVDLDTGRSLLPGETAEGVDLNHPHNDGLISDGSLVVTGKSKQHQSSEEKN
jgi:hypothetical protein